MIESTMGTQVLNEADLIDIVKQHFYKYGQGFKNVKITTDLAQRDQPRIGMELGLENLNPALPNDEVEKAYYSLLNTCKESTNVENLILDKIFDMIKRGRMNSSIFKALIKKLKGS